MSPDRGPPDAVAAKTIATDERFMRLALALGHRHLGLAWPNPSVGAVVVRHEAEGPRIVGQGITQRGGRPHAERIALAAAGAAARDSTLYVSLEPCAHYGKTPPCVEAIVAAGVARVVTALEDPDPRVGGEGHRFLRRAGVAVETGVLAAAAAALHRGHVMRVTQGRPAVTLKLARTRDGFAARKAAPRLLITGEAANARVHLMRAHADAVLVGVGTILADDPLLTVRLPGLERRSPVRVVLDSRRRTPPTARVVATAGDAPTWIVGTLDPSADEAVDARFDVLHQGLDVLHVRADGAGRIDLAAALRLLAGRGITRLFCEAGPRLADALAAQNLVDEILLITGPDTLGEPGLAAIGPNLAAALESGFRPAGAEPAGRDRIEFFERAA